MIEQQLALITKPMFIGIFQDNLLNIPPTLKLLNIIKYSEKFQYEWSKIFLTMIQLQKRLK